MNMTSDKIFYNIYESLTEVFSNMRNPIGSTTALITAGLFVIAGTFVHSELRGINKIIRNLCYVIAEKENGQQPNIESSLMYIHGSPNEDITMDEVVRRILHVGYKLLNSQYILVMIPQKNKNKLFVHLLGSKKVFEADSTKGICGFLMSTGETLNISDINADARFALDEYMPKETASILAIPIILQPGETIGLIFALNRRNEGDRSSTSFFTQGDEELINSIAANACLAISRAQFYHKAMVAKRKSTAMLSIVRARTSDQSIENILNITIEAAYDLLLPERVTVYMCDHRKEEAWICASKDGLYGFTIQFGQGVAGKVAATGETIRIENVYEDPRFLPDVDLSTGFKTKSMLCAAVPGFGTGSKPVAVIQLMNKSDNHNFDEEDEAALTDFCEEVSLAFRRKLLEISLLKVARSLQEDSESVKYSSARLEESLLKEYASVAQRSHYALSVITRENAAEHLVEVSPRGRTTNQFVSKSEDAIYELIHRWDVDPFEIRESDLMLYAEQMFIFYCLPTRFNISMAKLRSFIMAAHSHYRSANTFHNFRHGWSVMHMTYQILRHGAAQHLTSLEIFACLIGSLCHDLDHPGVSNAFEVASWSDLSLMHGDDAVLERHHVAMTLKLLRVPDNDILENLSPQEKLEMRRLLYSGIMATDMARHFDHVEHLIICSKSNPPVDPSDAEARRTFLGSVIHCADLSGQALKLELALKWGDGLLQEFQAQARKEEELKIPVTPFMQGLENELTAMQLQLGFVSNIVVPLWNALSEVFPEVKHMAKQVYENKLYYKERINVLSTVESPKEPNEK